MVKGGGGGGGGQNLPADVAQVIDQLERHCLAPDGSLVPKPAFFDLQLAREEMSRERLRYLEAMAIYCEAMAMVEEYQQAVSVGNLGGIRDVQGLYPQLGLINSPQVYETLEHRMVIAEAAQKLRLPLISKDGEIHEDDIEKLSIMSRSSLDSTATSFTISSSSNSMNYTTANSTASMTNNALSAGDAVEPGVGGVPNRYLGITPAYLWQTQLQRTPLSVDMTEYQMCLSREIEARLKAKCEKLADAFVMDDIDSSSGHQTSSSRLPESTEHNHQSPIFVIMVFICSPVYINMLLLWISRLLYMHKNCFIITIIFASPSPCSNRCYFLPSLLRVLENVLLLETYTQESIPALHKIRKYLLEATEEASIAYNKAVTRLREYQGVDPHFDTIARQYHDIVKKLENMQWTIHQVEMDLKRLPDHQTT
ncbi:AUGMIN subunit 4 [Quercus suber]|uniref:AUGMIN subunit 4 n=1 Tax=Quercus suber TaxID=58331 RepID=UPI0032E029A0